MKRCALALAPLLLLAVLARWRMPKTLYLYIWNNYLSDDTVHRFEAQCAAG
jgi:hypothetical protein